MQNNCKVCQRFLTADAEMIAFHPFAVPVWDERDILDFRGCAIRSLDKDGRAI